MNNISPPPVLEVFWLQTLKVRRLCRNILKLRAVEEGTPRRQQQNPRGGFVTLMQGCQGVGFLPSRLLE